jgi:hypothetical protein
MSADLQPTIARVDGGWRLHWGPFRIVTTRTQAAAQAVSKLLDTLTNLPALTPASLVMLAGYLPGQVIGPKYRPLSELWGWRLTAQWNATRTTIVETTLPTWAETFSHFVGQTVEPIFEE